MRLKLIIILLVCLNTFCGHAASIEFDSKISNVMVYRNGARITRDAKIDIPAGQSEIVFSNLTTQINTHSLQAYVPEGVDLVTVLYRTSDLRNAELSDREKTIQEELAALRITLDWVNKQLAVYNEEEKILRIKPSEINSNDKGISVQDFKEYTKYYRDRSLEVKKKQFDLTNESRGINAKIALLQGELNTMSASKSKKIGEVVFLVQSEVARRCELSFSYVSNQAGWVPVYDLKAKDAQSPIALHLKANVHQNTGIDWEKVKMSVSTGNPLLGNDRPILRPKYVTFAAVARIRAQESTSNIAYDMKNKDEMSEEEKKMYYEPNNQVVDTETTREYNISLLQTVPSSGLKRLVQLKKYDIEAEYRYHAVPKLSQGVFLLAEVANWGQYNLLPGTANIFFQNTYIGQSQINSNITAEKILLSLGRDESIKIARERTNYLEKTTFFGGNAIQNFEYTITVRNTKSKSVKIEILDQIPLSNHEDIKIELRDYDKAVYDEKTGGLKWVFELGAGASEKLVFRYSQKAPKGMPLALN